MENNLTYKMLFDLAMEDSEEPLLFEMNDGNIFLVKFSHLDIDIANAIDEYIESRGLIYKVMKVIKNVSYDYSNIFIEITRDYLPKTFNVISENEVS